MEDILKLAKENQIEKIIECIKTKQTNEEGKEIIMQLPDAIKIQLMDRIKDFYIVEASNGLKIISRTDLIQKYEYDIMSSLSNENLLDYLKSKSDKEKLNFVEAFDLDDKIKQKIIDIIEDFPYKLLIASKIGNMELQNNIIHKIEVSDTFLKLRSETYELDSLENKKYKTLRIPKELTFGIEIEGVNRNYAGILQQMGGLTGELLYWNAKGDPTIDVEDKDKNGIDYGLEIVSPILKDDTEYMQQIYTVCNILYELGTTVNSECGGHIHFGRSYFSKPKELWNLIEIYGMCEGIFNLIINEPGTLPRDSLNRFARSTYKKILEANVDVNSYNDIDEYILKLIDIQNAKVYNVNISKDHDTIEFRAPNGSIKPEIWLENIKLFGKLIETSKELENNVIPEFDKKRSLFTQLSEADDETIKCDLLLDLLLDDENERKIYKNRFDVNRSLQFDMEDFREIYIANENSINPNVDDVTKEGR